MSLYETTFNFGFQAKQTKRARADQRFCVMGMSGCCRFVSATRFLANLAKQKAPFGKIDDERKERPLYGAKGQKFATLWQEYGTSSRSSVPPYSLELALLD